MKIKPFRALRPAVSLADCVASVPYDVVDTIEARALAAGNPFSFLHVSRPEIDLPDGADPYADSVYRQGAERLRTMVGEGTLLREEVPMLYVYRQTMGMHQQYGLVVCCHIDDYLNDIIRKHEKTRKDKEEDRTRHCQLVEAHTGPVFLTYRDTAGIADRMARTAKTEPLYDFVAVDGIGHTVWKAVGDTIDWVEAFEQIPLAYIADGHHRAAASARTGLEMRQSTGNLDAAAPFNWFLAVLFPQDQLKVLAYNRCVADLNGLTKEAFLARVSEIFVCSPATDGVPTKAGTCRMYLDHAWYDLSWDIPESDPVSKLDVSVLQDRLLAPILGLDDPRTSGRIAFIGGIRGSEALITRVDSGRDAVAFSMIPVSVTQVMDIADANQIMPPKSTWFEPKLRSGLLVHTLDD